MGNAAVAAGLLRQPLRQLGLGHAVEQERMDGAAVAEPEIVLAVGNGRRSGAAVVLAGGEAVVAAAVAASTTTRSGGTVADARRRAGSGLGAWR